MCARRLAYDPVKRRVRAIFIGCGAAGGDWLRLFLKEPDAELAGVVEPSAAAITKLKLPSETPVFADVNAALEGVQADVAFIASPNAHHAPQFLVCAERGLHIFIEKPVALTLDDAIKMKTAANRQRIKTYTPWGAERHFFLRESIERFRSGKLGKLVQVHGVTVGGNGFFRDVGDHAHYSTRQPEISGGLIAHHTSHLIDWAMQIGGPVESVFCQTDTTFPNPKPRQVEAAAAILRFRHGGTATLMESMLWHRYLHWDVIGEQAGDFIEWNPEARGADLYLKIEQAAGEKTHPQIMTFNEFRNRVDSESSLVRRFLDLVACDQPSPSSIDRAIATMKVCEALHASARTGNAVVLKRSSTENHSG